MTMSADGGPGKGRQRTRNRAPEQRRQIELGRLLQVSGLPGAASYDAAVIVGICAAAADLLLNGDPSSIPAYRQAMIERGLQVYQDKGRAPPRAPAKQLRPQTTSQAETTPRPWTTAK